MATIISWMTKMTLEIRRTGNASRSNLRVKTSNFKAPKILNFEGFIYCDEAELAGFFFPGKTLQHRPILTCINGLIDTIKHLRTVIAGLQR
jgi:hypothetical protein